MELSTSVSNLYFRFNFALDAIEKNKKGMQIYSAPPGLCAMNQKGEFICCDNQYIRKINPRNTSENTTTFVEGVKKAIAVYK